MKKLLVLSLIILIASCSKSSKTQPSASDLNFFSKNNNAKTSTINADCYADCNLGVDTNPGTNASPKKHIQACINLSSIVDGSTVIAKSGTPTTPKIYLENINFNGKNITVASNFINTGDPHDIYGTIIDGNHNGSVVTIASKEDNNAQLMGFTIQNGLAANGGGIYVAGAGETIYNDGQQFATTPQLRNLKITLNTATSFGGGIFIADSELPNTTPVVMQNLEISSNNAAQGGGIFANIATLSLTDTKLIGNTAAGDDAAMSLISVTAVGDIDKLYIEGNHVEGGSCAGGRIRPISVYGMTPNNSTNIRVTNSVVVNNIASLKGDSCNDTGKCGGLCAEVGFDNYGIISKVDLVNSTFAKNKSKSQQSGGLCILLHDLGRVNVINSIFWDNTKNYGSLNIPESAHQITIINSPGSLANNVGLAYNDIQGGFSDIITYDIPNNSYYQPASSIFLSGNINLDPLFVDPINGNYSINLNSPAVNTGTNSISIGGQSIAIPTDDIVNMLRPSPSGTKVDMGAYEVEQVVIPTFDSRPSNGLTVKPFKPRPH